MLVTCITRIGNHDGRTMASRVITVDRIVPTVRKHIVPEETLPSAAIGVCVEEALDDGGVISALEVIEASLFSSGLPLRANFAGFFDR